jgi:ABC-type branched-subunit amino acid transport system substrate-binding protein
MRGLPRSVRSRLLLAPGLLALVWLAGCAQPTVLRDGVRISVQRAVEQDVHRARTYLEEGRSAEARELLQTLHARFPRARNADEVLWWLAEAEWQGGDPDAAVSAWRTLLARHSRSPRAPLTRMRLAERYRELDRPALAREVLEGARFERADEALRVRMYRMLADLAREAGEYAEAVRWLALTRRETSDPEQHFALDLEWEELLEDRVSDAELAALVERLPRGPVFDRALLVHARRALGAGDAATALASLERMPRRLRPVDERERERLLERARRTAALTVHTLGLALPLTGPYSPFGESVLRGLALGLEVFEDPPAPYRVLVRDTRGEPERAAQAVQELAEAGVEAIVGPLRSGEAEAAAPVAERYRVPLLTFAGREELPSLGHYVFRVGLTASDQVRALADYATDVRGHRRFAILYPRDAYGTRFKNLFWEAVLERGGEIVAVEGYATDAVDLQTEIKKLVGLHYVTASERRRIEERDRLARRPLDNAERLAHPDLANLPPWVDFEALFIPEEAQRVGLILPQLRFYDVRDVTLLGPSGWNDRVLLEIAGREARGAVFTDAFFAQSDYPFVQEFVSRFYAAYAEEPDRLAAEGYDAAAILRGFLDSSSFASPEQLARALVGVRDFPGVSGVTSFDEAGGTRKALYLLTVRRGEFEELSQTP